MTKPIKLREKDIPAVAIALDNPENLTLDEIADQKFNYYNSSGLKAALRRLGFRIKKRRRWELEAIEK